MLKVTIEYEYGENEYRVFDYFDYAGAYISELGCSENKVVKVTIEVK